MPPKSKKQWVVYLSTFPPRVCGIATFTQDIARAFDELFAPAIESRIVSMNVDEVTRFNYPVKVIDEINQSKPADYERVAKSLNNVPMVKLINIQHEFGIFGDHWGKNLLIFLTHIKKPVVTTFHTVLPSPDPELKRVVTQIAALSFRIITMTRHAREILVNEYGIKEKKIEIIPHGIHPVPFEASEKAKHSLNLAGRTVLSTFGLLSKDKGIEYVIESLPAVVKKFPDSLYLIVGATHPLVVRREGEQYRNSLVEKIYRLKLTEHVKFINRYLELPELLEFLKATDIYVSTSLNPNQAVSGTLSYALGTGRPVVSTAFAQAKEDVPSDVGLLVDFKKPKAYQDALLTLLQDGARRGAMGRKAYSLTRNMTWPNVSIAYMKVFSKAVPTFVHREKNLPPVKLVHIQRLTDKFGMFQFANLTDPDSAFGYTADDNARALIAACLHYERFGSPRALQLAEVYLNFLTHVARADGYFHNYVRADHSLDTSIPASESVEDATGRSLYALAVLATGKYMPLRMRQKARDLFFRSFNAHIHFTHLRAIAFYVKGLSLLAGSGTALPEKRIFAELDRTSGLLVSAFQQNADKKWQWFEQKLTYSNATLTDALFCAYAVAKRRRIEWLEIGLKALEFLIAETFVDSMYIPIGQDGWYHMGRKRSRHDQQPEEPSAMVQALKSAYMVTKDDHYRACMHRVFAWFLGDNTLGRIMYDATTGGCYDGLGKRDINLNQGAESTLSYLIARLLV